MRTDGRRATARAPPRRSELAVAAPHCRALFVVVDVRRPALLLLKLKVTTRVPLESLESRVSAASCWRGCGLWAVGCSVLRDVCPIKCLPASTGGGLWVGMGRCYSVAQGEVLEDVRCGLPRRRWHWQGVGIGGEAPSWRREMWSLQRGKEVAVETNIGGMRGTAPDQSQRTKIFDTTYFVGFAVW